MLRKLNDFEILYLLKNNCSYTLELMVDKYKPLLYKTIYQYNNNFSFIGYENNDLYQVGKLALHESCLNFKDQLNVPFFSFVRLCIERKIGGFIRIYNSQAAKLFYQCLSFDNYVNEEENIYLYDVICDSVQKKSAFITYQSELINLIKNKDDLITFEKSVLILKILGFNYKDMSKILDVSVKKVDNTLQKVKTLI